MHPDMRYRLATAQMAELQLAAAGERLSRRDERPAAAGMARPRPRFGFRLYPVRTLLAALPILRSTAGECE